MKVPFINFDYEMEALGSKYEGLFLDHIHRGEFIGGDSVTSFENSLSNYLGTKNIISVGNGTDALIIGLLSLKLKKREVIVPSFSFFATSEAIVQAGLVPVFVDIDYKDCNIDVSKIESKITENTGAILPVHLFGNSSDMNTIISIAEKYDLMILEDVAQSFGTKYEDKHLGTLGDIGCFSFFPTKTLGAYGDGGAIATDNDEIAEYARMLKNHGSKQKYINEVFGFNSRLDSIQASVLNLKLNHIDTWIEKRILAGKYYDEKLSNLENLKLIDNSNSTYNYYSIYILENKRDHFKNYLDEKNIANAIYYPKTLPSLPAHNSSEKFPVSEKICDEIISLPIWPGISDDELAYVTDSIIKYFTQ